jgi:hypothetical protein
MNDLMIERFNKEHDLKDMTGVMECIHHIISRIWQLKLSNKQRNLRLSNKVR